MGVRSEGDVHLQPIATYDPSSSVKNDVMTNIISFRIERSLHL
jgi:hypothetical protein